MSKASEYSKRKSGENTAVVAPTAVNVGAAAVKTKNKAQVYSEKKRITGNTVLSRKESLAARQEPTASAKNIVNYQKLTLQEKRMTEQERKEQEQAKQTQYWYDYDVDAAQKELDALEYEPAPFISADWWKGVAEEFATAGKNTERSNPQAEQEKQARISQLSQEINIAKKYQQAKQYYDLTQSEDFETLSKDERHKGTDYYDWIFGREVVPEDISLVEDLYGPKDVQIYEDLVREHGEGSDEAMSFLRGRLANDTGKLIDADYKYLSDEERDIFRYILNKEGTEAAEKYLDWMRENVTVRRADADHKKRQANKETYNGVFKTLDDALDVAYAFDSGVDSFGEGLAAHFSEEAPKTTYQQAMLENMREDAEGFKAGAMDVAQSIGQQVPAVAISMIPAVGETISKAAWTASAAGNARAEALKMGYSPEKASEYGWASGLAEVGLGYLLGGIPGLSKGSFGKVAGSLLGKGLSKLPNTLQTLARFGVTTLGDAGGEELEERLQDGVIDPFLRNAIFGEENKIDFFSDEAKHSGQIGFWTSLVMNAVGINGAWNKANVETYANNMLVHTKGLQSQEVLQARENLIAKVEAGEVVQKDFEAVAEAVVKESLALIDTAAEMASGIDSSVRTAEEIGEVLTKNGVDAQQAGAIAEALEAFSRGETPTAEQLELVKSTEQSRKLFSEYFGKDIDLDADGALAAVIARVDRDSEVEKDLYEAVRSHLSEEGRAYFDLAMMDATEENAQSIADAFEMQYLRGFIGNEYKADSTAISNAMQEAAYEAGANAKKSLGTVSISEGVTVSDEFRATLARVAKDLHTHITYGGTAPTRNGFTERGYSTKYGELHIYADAKVKGANGTTLYGERAAAVIIAGHELTHRLQQLAPSEYAAFRDYAVAQMGRDKAVAKYMRKYDLDDTDAMDEIAANFAMTTLFFDEKTIREITKKRSKLAQAIRNILQWIKDKLHFKTSDIDRAIRLWNDAYNASRRNAKDPQVHDDVAKGKEEVKHSRNPNLDEHGKVKYNSSIKWVYDAGLFDGGQARKFFAAVADIQKRGHKFYQKARNGDKIVEVDNMLVYFYSLSEISIGVYN